MPSEGLFGKLREHNRKHIETTSENVGKGKHNGVIEEVKVPIFAL